MTDADEKQLNARHAPREVWVTHHALDVSDPKKQFAVSVSMKPWETGYDAPITLWAANTRYVRGEDYEVLWAKLQRLTETLERCPATSNPRVSAQEHLDRIETWWRLEARAALACVKGGAK